MESSEIGEIEEKFLDNIIENFKKNSEEWDLYSKEEVLRFLNNIYDII